MIVTDSMMQKISEPGLWFVKSSKPIADMSTLIYELAVEGCAHLYVNTQYKKEIEREVIAKVMKDRLDEAADQNERSWLEQEMSEYDEHGFFFYPEEMNDYVENGPFWKEDVYIDDYPYLSLFDYPSKAAIVESVSFLPLEDDRDLKDNLLTIHNEAMEYEKTMIVLVQVKDYGPATEFIETHLFV